jgi:hypothetical protein
MQTKQQLIDTVLLSVITDPGKQIEYFQRGFLQKISNNPPDYCWRPDKFQWYQTEDIQEILDDIKQIP